MNHRGVTTRLTRIEDALPIGCAHCRHWTPVSLGNEDGSRSRPDDCPVCGRNVPVRLVHVIVGVPWEVL